MKKVELVIDGVSVDITSHVWGLWESCSTGVFYAKTDLAEMEKGTFPVDPEEAATDREMVKGGEFICKLLEQILDSDD